MEANLENGISLKFKRKQLVNSAGDHILAAMASAASRDRYQRSPETHPHTQQVWSLHLLI